MRAWVAGIVATEVVLFALLGQLGAPVRGGDGQTYLLLASNLVHHHAFSESQGLPLDASVLRAPGYPLFLALLQIAGLKSLAAIRIAQLLLLGATAYLTGLVAQRIAGARAGLIAAVATATYLPLVWVAADQMTESLAALGFVALALLLLDERWMLAGLALALTAYVRPTTLYVAIPVALFVLVQTRRPAAAGRFAAVVVLVVAPWGIRTSLLAHHVVPLQAGAGAGAYASAGQFAGTLPIPLQGTGWVRFKTVSRRISHPLRDGRYTPREQLEFDRRFARAAPPFTAGDVVRRLPARLAALWGPADGTPRAQAWSAAAHRLALLQFWALCAFALAAVAGPLRRTLRWWPLWLPALYLTAVHTVLHVETRYTLPARPLLIAIAAVGLAAAWERQGNPSTVQRAKRSGARANSPAHASVQK